MVLVSHHHTIIQVSSTTKIHLSWIRQTSACFSSIISSLPPLTLSPMHVALSLSLNRSMPKRGLCWFESYYQQWRKSGVRWNSGPQKYRLGGAMWSMKAALECRNGRRRWSSLLSEARDWWMQLEQFLKGAHYLILTIIVISTRSASKSTGV